MTRGNFFKALVGILIVPKAIVEIAQSVQPKEFQWTSHHRIGQQYFEMPAGTNVVVGQVYEKNENRIIWFNNNSNGNHGIYQFNLKTQEISQIN